MPTAPRHWQGGLDSGLSPIHSDSAGGDDATDASHIKKAWIAAFITLHITRSARGLYVEESWIRTADHGLDSTFTNMAVFGKRGGWKGVEWKGRA